MNYHSKGQRVVTVVFVFVFAVKLLSSNSAHDFWRLR